MSKLSRIRQRKRPWARTGLALALASGVIGATLVSSPALASGQLPDVLVNLTNGDGGEFPTSADGRSTFSIRTEISAAAGADANDVEFTVKLPVGSTDLEATCDPTPEGSATCEDSALVVNDNVVSGTIDSLPATSSSFITITGKWPLGSAGTVTAVANDPSGDADPNSNTAKQTIAFDSAALVQTTKTQDKEVVGLGEPRTYIVTFANASDIDLSGATLSDRFEIRSGALRGNVLTYTVACDQSLSTAPCPVWADGTTKTSSGFETTLFSGKADLPPHKKVVLTVKTTQDATCVTGAMFAHKNVATFTLPTGATAATGSVQTAEVYGSVSGAPQCPTATGGPTKTQRGTDTIAKADGDRVFEISFTNTTGEDLVGMKLHDDMRVGTSAVSVRNLQASWIVTCAADSEVECPEGAVEGRTPEGATYGYQNNIAMFGQEGMAFDVPAGKTLRLEVATDIVGTCMTLQRSTSVYNTVRASTAEGTPIGQPGILANALVTGAVCPTVHVWTTLDRGDGKPWNALRPGVPDADLVGFKNYSKNVDLQAADVRFFMQEGGGVVTKETSKVICDTALSSPGVCETWVPGEPSSSQYFQGTVDLPAEAEVMFRIESTYAVEHCSEGTMTRNFRVRASIQKGSNPHELSGLTNTNAQREITCANATVTNSVQAPTAEAAQPYSVSATFTGAVGAASGMKLILELPSNGFAVDPQRLADQVTCQTSSEKLAVCPEEWEIQAGSNKDTFALVAVTPLLAKGEKLKVTVNGHAGILPAGDGSGTYPFVTRIEGGGLPQGHKTAQSNFAINNSRTTITVVQQIPGGAPTALEFAGVLSCEAQGDFPFTIEVKAHGSLASGTIVAHEKLWKHDNCSVKMTEPAAPDGYFWQEWQTDAVQAREGIVEPLVLTFAIPLQKSSDETPGGETPGGETPGDEPDGGNDPGQHSDAPAASTGEQLSLTGTNAPVALGIITALLIAAGLVLFWTRRIRKVSQIEEA